MTIEVEYYEQSQVCKAQALQPQSTRKQVQDPNIQSKHNIEPTPIINQLVYIYLLTRIKLP